MLDSNVNLFRWLIFFLIKSASLLNKFPSGGTVKNEIISNKKSTKELHKSIIGKFGKKQL